MGREQGVDLAAAWDCLEEKVKANAAAFDRSLRDPEMAALAESYSSVLLTIIAEARRAGDES
jgi:hypothetical protein